jgi:ADP-ribose diphosphatase
VIAGELTHLAAIDPDAGISPSTVHVFATQITGRPVPDRFEGFGEIRRLSPAELDQWIAEGRITDAFTLAAVTVARARGLLTT